MGVSPNQGLRVPEGRRTQPGAWIPDGSLFHHSHPSHLTVLGLRTVHRAQDGTLCKERSTFQPARPKQESTAETCGHSWGKERAGWSERVTSNLYIPICKTDSQWEFAVQYRELNPLVCDNLEGWEETQEGGDICILTASSRCCTAETKTL